MTEQQCHDAAARREYLDGYRQEPCQRMQEINEVRDHPGSSTEADPWKEGH